MDGANLIEILCVEQIKSICRLVFIWTILPLSLFPLFILFSAMCVWGDVLTVDNSFQFDATRDLLRELDVNDIVWIGLMRPQNSDRFMWS